MARITRPCPVAFIKTAKWRGDELSSFLIQIQKYRRDPKGSEIENVFVDALFQGFDAEQEPTDLTVAQVLMDTVPLSRLMAEQISALRNWAKGRARPATTSQQSEPGLRKIAA